MNKIILIAGYNNSWASLLVAEKLRLAGNTPKMILIAYPFSVKRVKTIIRNRGLQAIKNYIFKIKKSGNKDLLVEKELRSMGINSPSLKKWSKKNNVKLVQSSSINSKKSIDAVKEMNPDITAYTGGGIIKNKFIEASNNKILNAHSGRMPEIRGMSALEWSILLNTPIGVTTHFIDKGIDTGAIVDWHEIKATKNENLDSLRQKIVLSGCNMLVKNINKFLDGETVAKVSKTPLSRQCFIISDALKEIVELRLNS